MKTKRWLSALIAGVMVLAAAPLGTQVEAAESPEVTMSMPQGAIVGTETEFTVTTSGSYDQTKMVQGKFELTGGDATLQYFETTDSTWRELTGDTFGPASGFPFTDGATSNFKVTFNEAGTYSYKIAIVEVGTGAEVASIEGTVVAAGADIVITDCGPWGDAWPGAYNLGWKYINGFNTADIASIRVGMIDKKNRVIIEYTADKDQVAWQSLNGYITAAGLSSAPFYKEYNGEAIQSGRDSDWTVTLGTGFYAWQPSLFYVEVGTNSGEVYYKEMAYEGNFSCIHEFVSHVSAKDATCTEPGNNEYWYCPDCGKYFSDASLTNEITKDKTVVAAAGHHAVKVEAKKPTADKAGNIEYWYCDVCGKYFSDEALTKEISKEDTVLAATGKADVSKVNGAPGTGDPAGLMLWAVVLALATGAMVYAGKKARS